MILRSDLRFVDLLNLRHAIRSRHLGRGLLRSAPTWFVSLGQMLFSGQFLDEPYR
jgi:hypothetical protein